MKEIFLTQNKVALVDDEDFESLNNLKWQYVNGYARTKLFINGRNKSISMHRILMNVRDENIFIDHVDRCGLNNQKANLRFCTASQNRANSQGRWGTSKYKGVHKIGNKWRATITVQGKIMHLGIFANEIDAALAYDKRAQELFGEFSNPNF